MDRNDEDCVVRRGMLLVHLDGLLGGWKKRFVVARELGTLDVFKDETAFNSGDTPLSVMSLVGTIVTFGADKQGRKFCFEIRSGPHVAVLAAEGDQERLSWVAELKALTGEQYEPPSCDEAMTPSKNSALGSSIDDRRHSLSDDGYDPIRLHFESVDDMETPYEDSPKKKGGFLFKKDKPDPYAAWDVDNLDEASATRTSMDREYDEPEAIEGAGYTRRREGGKVIPTEQCTCLLM